MSELTTAPVSGEQLKNQIRARIFDSTNSQPKAMRISFMGAEIEIRQPAIGQFLGNADDTDTRNRLMKILIHNSFVPDTNERVFTEGDYDSLIALPFTTDMSGVIETINKLTGVDLKEKVKN